MRASGWAAMLAASAALTGSLRAAQAEGEAPPAPPSSAVAADAATAPWFGPVHQRAVGSVVRVESASGVGAGFVFASPRHIATSFHVVAVGREVNVVFHDGRTASADVVATDPENDLAILAVAEPATTAPLAASAEAIGLGTPVLVIGHPHAAGASTAARDKALL